MGVFQIGSTAVQLSQEATEPSLLVNQGASTVYLDRDTSVNPISAALRLYPNQPLNWQGGELYAVCNAGETSQVSQLFNAAGTTLPFATVAGNVGAKVTNTYAYLGQYQFNAPIGPLDVSAYSSLIILPINFGASGFDLTISWGNNVNFYDVGDSAGWNGTSLSGMFVVPVRAAFAQFIVNNPGAGNPAFYVYASANPIPAGYFNNAGSGGTFPFESLRGYSFTLGAGTGGTQQVSTRAGRAHVVVNNAGTVTNTGQGVVVEFNDAGGRTVDRHILFDANQFQALAYDIIVPRRAVQLTVSNFTAITQTVSVTISYDT